MPRDESEKKRWPWWSKLLLIMSPIFVLFVVVVVFEAGGRRSFNHAMQEARDIGGPVTFDEIGAARKVLPDEVNGALIITPLTGQLSLATDDPARELLPLLGLADLPPLGEKWPDQTGQVVRDHLARLSADLNKIDGLARCESGGMPLEVAPNPFDTILPSLAQVRESCRLKSLQVINEAMQGNTKSLAADLDVLLRHGQTLADHPTLISSLVHVATDSLALDVLQRVLGQTSVSAERLGQIEPLVRAVEDEDRLYWGIRGERAMLVGAVNWMTTSGARGIPGAAPLPLPANIPGVRGWVMGDMAEGLRLENRLVRAKGHRERIKAATEVETAVVRLPRYRVLSRTLIPSMKRAFELDLRATAMARATRAALAAERYRLDKGRFPDKLEELVPSYLDAVPTDPFDDKPLRYRVDSDGVVVYSIAEDKKDDGGQVQHRMPPKSRPTDAGFVLLKPEFRGRPASTTAPATQEAEAAAVSRGPAR